MTMRVTEKTGKMVSIMEVVDADDLIVITNKGVLMRQPVSQIRTIGRVTQGVKLVKLDDGTKISSISRVINEDTSRDNYDKTEDEHEDEINEKTAGGNDTNEQKTNENIEA
jgi:DNA gyrase subunit A